MNVTFMIGNGFDLNLGLDTQYSDFIKVYCASTYNDEANIKKFKKEIINPNLSLWSNAELAFGKQTSCITDDFTVMDYCNCHSDFCRSLARYLRKQQKRLILDKENVKSVCGSFSKAVNNVTDGFRMVPKTRIQTLFTKNEPLVFNFIDFNYTDTLDRICLETRKTVGWGSHYNSQNTMLNLIHTHGTVVKDMVLGVNDETQIANLQAFQNYDAFYQAQMIKSQTDLINEENTYNESLKILNASHFIYIYGMSIGETDRYWWTKLCNLLLSNVALQIVIHCYDAPSDELLRFDIKRYEERQKKRLFELGGVSEEKRKNIQDRIYITGTNLFEELKGIVRQNDEQAKAS